ncbi:MAG: lysozyme inhibitor LprI family protein [Thiohalocapsa sp.]|nr:lysozyme inhibitor LprI family protein [Thiohalocapsa sp.]MCF7990154.1 lysozyme inhibitor LprI family protein [Thiohalocapsa sp.]
MTVIRLPFIAAFAAAFSLAGSNAWSASPSFDCAKASSEAEAMICKDAELAELDRSLASLYAVVLKNTPATEKKMLKAEQRGWVKGRDDCWKSDDLRGCVEAEYRSRIAELRDR